MPTFTQYSIPYLLCRALPLVVVAGDAGEGLTHRQAPAGLRLVVGGLACSRGEIGPGITRGCQGSAEDDVSDSEVS